MHEKIVLQVIPPDAQQAQHGVKPHLEIKLEHLRIGSFFYVLQHMLKGHFRVRCDVLTMDYSHVIIGVLLEQSIANRE